ncbi:cuticlin-4-like [Paramacrobiotus metropolitanus]|uniref:cuticlin-4-like n=1 Tax=Paramacrobiotus metropolitanus TaxID=2943436 RepID=UPI002446290B|nr:cuticlin-4-like [Paramacrobiotus metropolitanus]
MERNILLGIVFLIFCDVCSCLSNAVISPAVVQVQCTNRVVSVTLKTEGEFNGVLYVGLHNKECRMLGKGQKKLEFSLPVKQCGIVTVKSPTDANKVVHKVQIYVQHHPMLQMEKDQRSIEECVAASDPSAVGEGFISDAANTVEVIAPAWMEIVRGAQADGPKIRGPVVLGETISVLTKVNAKQGQDALVTHCLASDGTSSDPELLIGDDGCATDNSIVPAFAKISGNTGPLTFWTKFPAFKFPDRQRLYLTCQVVICDGTCPQPRCTRKPRQVVGPNDGWKPANQVTELDVANSVQVVNSDLEGQVAADPYALEEKDENRICWPLKNLMTAIGILAAILLIALILAICFWWNRRQRRRKQMDDSYGTQTNSLYNPSTNYYYMDQYGDSQNYSGNGQSVNGRSHAGSQQPPRTYRSETSH